ncbi:DUF4328 domain-containing protein [Flagellimonas sp.]|uniref:DUF4328 domain-containing protein n=1 Tax=Flagellimonas sp. TaxID=2058762 RepID=UPI003B529688
MTREEQLVFCKKCKHRYLDFDRGILCKITKKEADFEDECSFYVHDPESSIVPKITNLIKPNRQRAKWAEYLIWAILALSIFSLISSYLQHDLLLKIQEGFPVSDHQLEMNDLREGIVGILTIILYVISVITFIRWFRRAYFNLHSRSANPTYDEGWAAGAWFVPILNLFRPYKIMEELDEKMSYLIKQRTEEEVKSNKPLIGAWWALWILGGIIGKYIAKAGLKAETLEEYISSTNADMLGIIFDIPLSLLAIFVIRTVSKKEERLVHLEAQDSNKSNTEVE